MRLIRVALSRGVAAVDVDAPHLGPGLHTLQLRVNDEAVVVLAAELAGETASGSYALRLAPLDASHIPELAALVEGAPRIGKPAPPAAERPEAPARKVAESVPDLEDELGASVLFDPEAALISRAPPRPDGTKPDDTLTIPLRTSMVPPELAPPSAPQPPKRPPSGPHTISHLSFPSTTAAISTQPYPHREDRRPTVEMPAAPVMSQRQASTQRQGSSAEVTITSTLELDNSPTAASTLHSTAWPADDGPAAADPSLAGSVLFDPDMLAREQRLDSKPPSGRHSHVAESFPRSGKVEAHSRGARGAEPLERAERAERQPALSDTQENEHSVVFGTEATTPGTPPSRDSARGRAVAVVVSDEHEDPSLTPTAPMDVPARRAPSFRRDPDEVVDDDAATFQLSSQHDPVASSAASSGRGPRTMRRSGNHGIVVVGRIIANRYRIDSLVGTGAVGAVYRASHLELPRTYALKVLHPHFRTDQHLLASFRTEARAASLLDHPNVTIVHDFGEEPDGLVYIVMEYLAGVNLQAVLDEQRRIEPRRAIAVMVQVCAALAAAHERGIVHRDVKPDNIMLVPSRDDEGRPFEHVKVCDFGIAALETAPDANRGEWTAGTPEYMAPEQAYGRSDARTDVYACGIVLYEMVAGRPPFVGDSATETLAKQVNELPRPPSDLVHGLPNALERVILQAIEKAPERRFATMRELRLALKRLIS